MEIIVKNGKTLFESGQTVSGLIKLDTDHIVKDVKVELHGCAEVQWTEIASTVIAMYGHVQVVPNLTFREHKRFLELAQEVTNEEANLRRDIPFSFQLPENDIPGSFESEIGKITYKIVASYRLPEQVCKGEKLIEVSSPIKQNLLLPIGNSVEKDFGVLSLGAGRIILDVALAKKGFVVGEKIELSCHINNESTTEATPRAVLYQTQVYMCGDQHRGYHKEVTDPVVGQRVHKESNSNQVLSIPIPSDTILSVKSELISIKYFIHVTLDIPHAFDTHVNLPIVVSTQSALRV